MSYHFVNIYSDNWRIITWAAGRVPPDNSHLFLSHVCSLPRWGYWLGWNLAYWDFAYWELAYWKKPYWREEHVLNVKYVEKISWKEMWKRWKTRAHTFKDEKPVFSSYRQNAPQPPTAQRQRQRSLVQVVNPKKPIRVGLLSCSAF